MKAKQLLFVLFLAIQTLSIGLYATEETDDLSYTTTGLSDDNGAFELFAGATDVSDAVYAGVAQIVDGQIFLSDGEAVLFTTTSGGFVKSITIYWGASAFEEVDEVTIFAKSSAYTAEDLSGGGDELETILCNGTSSQTYDFSTDYSHFALISRYEAHIDHIEIVWTLRSDYAITKIAGSYGTITGAATAYAGDPVSLTMARLSGYAMTGYTVYKTGDPSTTVKDVSYAPVTSKQTISFTMPAYAVTVEGKFVTEPTVTITATIEDDSGNKLTALDAMTSGTTLTYNYSVPVDYTGDVSAATSNAECAQVSVIKTNAYSGRLIIRVYRKGKVRVSLSFTADAKYKARTFSSKSATVSSQNIILVTELDGRYYAVTHNILGATTEAQELLKQGSNYYYKTGVDISDITWGMEDMGSGYYISNSSDEYLTVDAATMSVEVSPFKWSKNASEVFINGYLTGLCYDKDYDAFTVNNQNEYKTLSNVSAPIHEVSVSNVLLATQYTRGLTNGNYATMCLPYPVSRSDDFFSGVEVYNLTGKFMDGETLTGIEITEETGTLVAGKPYIILATASTLSVWYGEETVGSPVAATGLVGNLSSTPIDVPAGCYGISANQIRKVVYEGTAHTGQYKAYIDLEGVPEAGGGGASAPGRRVLYAASEATSIEDLLNNVSVINWNEPVYNMLGQRVGKGTTGVLIQHGQKFLVK